MYTNNVNISYTTYIMSIISSHLCPSVHIVSNIVYVCLQKMSYGIYLIYYRILYVYIYIYRYISSHVKSCHVISYLIISYRVIVYLHHFTSDQRLDVFNCLERRKQCLHLELRLCCHHPQEFKVSSPQSPCVHLSVSDPCKQLQEKGLREL